MIPREYLCPRARTEINSAQITSNLLDHNHAQELMRPQDKQKDKDKGRRTPRRPGKEFKLFLSHNASAPLLFKHGTTKVSILSV